MRIEEREDEIARLIFALARDRDARAACVRMLATISVLAKQMSAANRMCCAAAMRSASDEIEVCPQSIC
jgi:hypothetical protein